MALPTMIAVVTVIILGFIRMFEVLHNMTGEVRRDGKEVTVMMVRV